MYRNRWYIKNISTDKNISLGDLSKLPSLSPGQEVDMLRYYDPDRIARSKNLITAIKSGWIQVRKIQDNDTEIVPASSPEEYLVQADKIDVTNVSNSVSNSNSSTSVNELTVSSSSETSVVLSTESNIVNLANCTNNNMTYTLPSPTNNSGIYFYIKKTDSSVNTVTIDGNGSTIDGESTKIIDIQYASVTIVCDGLNWHII